MHISTQGLVLREVNYKESDKLLTVLTAEGGKRTVKARGCRRKGSPLAAATAWNNVRNTGVMKLDSVRLANSVGSTASGT